MDLLTGILTQTPQFTGWPDGWLADLKNQENMSRVAFISERQTDEDFINVLR